MLHLICSIIQYYPVLSSIFFHLSSLHWDTDNVFLRLLFAFLDIGIYFPADQLDQWKQCRCVGLNLRTFDSHLLRLSRTHSASINHVSKASTVSRHRTSGHRIRPAKSRYSCRCVWQDTSIASLPLAAERMHMCACWLGPLAPVILVTHAGRTQFTCRSLRARRGASKF